MHGLLHVERGVAEDRVDLVEGGPAKKAKRVTP